MLNLIRRVFATGVVVFLLTMIGIAAFAALWPENPSEPADVIVVLGAGMDADGTLHRSSTLRVDRGVELWKAGLAPRMHFTGGRGRPDGPSAGERMAARATRAGVPPEAISHEDLSQSTLQNALFSQPMLEGAESLILVTEGFHLPRSYASFKWAGDHDLQLAFSERFRAYSPGSSFPQFSMVFREALASWFNLARAGGHDLAGLWGVPDEKRDLWLE